MGDREVKKLMGETLIRIYVTVHRNKFLCNKTNRRTNLPNLFLSRNSTYFGQFLCQTSGVFHCTFCSGVCHASVMTSNIKPAWHIPAPNVQWKTPDDWQRNCPKHVEFLDKNKFGKLVRLLVLLKRKKTLLKSHVRFYYAETVPSTWNSVNVFTHKSNVKDQTQGFLTTPRNFLNYVTSALEPGEAKWLRRCATRRTVPGSIPDGVTEYFSDIFPTVPWFWGRLSP